MYRLTREGDPIKTPWRELLVVKGEAAWVALCDVSRILERAVSPAEADEEL
jgi:hypothetical protein